eukprot:CAMPEP_0114510228 /NCGR_PEP_ID=MMETSP0109-20121206/13663_1 /TAXON_ID=29199 /ORGANISM="Chlorarachnion reptans, Strain CCCM449" /LENGTH=297 /DNA_ID=CAMNT_0001689497 /DNA_START=375 /DNA_END=1268 /DNA_ORIENTATION=-
MRADISELRERLRAVHVGDVLRSRWEALTKFTSDLNKLQPGVGVKKLVALRERVQIERHLQAILQVIAQKPTPKSPVQKQSVATETNLESQDTKEIANEQSSRNSTLQSTLASLERTVIKQPALKIVDVAEGSGIFYKTVALHQGRYWSVYDGATEYAIGKSVYKKFTREKKSGIFVHRTVSQAIQASFPKESAFLYKRRVILKVKATGSVRIHGPNKLAFEVVKPLRVVCELPRSKDIMNKVLSQISNAEEDASIPEKYRSLIGQGTVGGQGFVKIGSPFSKNGNVGNASAIELKQ